jgi:hypothetical protein
MKKLSLFTPIVITTIFLPTLPSWAKDCPTIPEQTTEVTVKDDSATLRTEPNKFSKKGLPIFEGDKLKVIDNNPTKDPEDKNYCWYKVKLLKDSNAKQYWVAGIRLSEFFSWSVNPSYTPTPTPINYSAPTGRSNSSVYNKSSTSWLIWLWLLPVIPTVILSVFLFKKIKNDQIQRENRLNKLLEIDRLSKLESTVTEQKSEIIKFMQEQIKREEHFNNSINMIIQKTFTVIEQNSDSLKQNSIVIESILDAIKVTKGSSCRVSNAGNINNRTENKKDLAEKSFESYDSKVSATTLESENQDDKKEWKKLVDEFNKRNKDHFTSLNLQFLKLNYQSIHGKPSTTGSIIVQLVSSTESEASYLKIEADQENWLFPNILSMQVDKIISNLKTSIFTRDPNSNNRGLIKPARLEEVSSDLWEIAETGEFET